MVCAALWLPESALAAGYKITPLVIDKEVSQRDIFTEMITVENIAQHKITLYPAVNAIAVDEGGDVTPFIDMAATPDKSSAITTWISLSRAPLDLMPGETVELPISFRIHQDAPGGHYQAFAGFGTGRNRAAAEQQVWDGQAPGVIITLAVDQNQIEFLKLGKFIVDKFVTNKDNAAISYVLSNPGEAAVVPTGEVILYNNRGDEVGSVPVNPNNIALEPGEEKELSAAVPVSGFLGKYKAFLSIDYGTEQVASVYDTAFYYVIPWQQLLIVFVIVLVSATLLTLYLSQRSARALAEEEDEAHYLPMHVLEGRSEDADHDINLKKE